MNPQEMVWRGKEWMDLVQDKDRWRVCVNDVMNL
jgi:hypothetical protein